MKFIAGNVCLDFVNTVGERHGTRFLRDKIANPADLIRWSELAGLSPPSPASPRIVKRAIALREALYAIFKSTLIHRRPSARAMETFLHELKIARAHEHLARSRDKFLWTWDQPRSPDRILWDLSRSAAQLLASPDLAKLRQCGGENCGWLFLDTSRNHSRRWCDMSDCGNRSKARLFRRRQRERYSET